MANVLSGALRRCNMKMRCFGAIFAKPNTSQLDIGAGTRLVGRRLFALDSWGHPDRATGSRGEYKIIKYLGEGGFGTVFEGRCADSARRVAVETLPLTNLMKNVEEARINVTREIFAMMSISHPYIVQLYDIVVHQNDHLCMVMEFCAGGSLANKISFSPPYKIHEDVARRYFQQLVDAVIFCHSRGVFHRDLKKQNLLLDANNVLKVADFGLSVILNWKDVGESGEPRGYQRAGTPSHMSPEVTSLTSPNEGYQLGPADIWSCGVILYNMLTGTTPFGHSREDMYYRMMHGQVEYPPFMSHIVREFIARFLEPNVAARIKPLEIYANAWFMKGYVPPNFRSIFEVNANLNAIEDVFSQALVHENRRVLLPNTPVEWYHVDVPIEYYRKAKPLSLKSPDTAEDAKELRFTSAYPPSDVLKQLVPILRGLGFETELHSTERKIKIFVPEARKPLWAEPLFIVGEVFQPAIGGTLAMSSFGE